MLKKTAKSITGIHYLYGRYYGDRKHASYIPADDAKTFQDRNTVTL